MLNERDVEEAFSSFAAGNGFQYSGGTSLIPQNDPSTLFVTAGIQSVRRQLMSGEVTANLANSQWCLRMRAIDEVGQGQKLTSFKMLTMLTFGRLAREAHLDRFLRYCHAVLRIATADLHFTASTAIEGEYDDEQSIRALEALGIAASNIRRWQRRWSRPFGPKAPTGPNLFVSCRSIDGAQRHLWNLEFLEYVHDGSRFVPAEHPVLDCAGSVETVLGVRNGTMDPFGGGVLADLQAAIAGDIDTGPIQQRILADHVRSIGLCALEGVHPSAKAHGAVLRRLITRSLDILWQSDADPSLLQAWVGHAMDLLSEETKMREVPGFGDEIIRFARVTSAGQRALDKAYIRFRDQADGMERMAYRAHSELGLPEGVILRWFRDRGIAFDEGSYLAAKDAHRQASRGKA